MDPHISLFVLPLALLWGALLTAGRTAFAQLPDSTVKKMADSENRSEQLIAKLLGRPALFLDRLKLANLFCAMACAISASVGLFWSLNFGPQPGTSPSISTERIMDLLFALAAVALPLLFYDVFCIRLPHSLACHSPRGVALALARFCWLASGMMRPFVAFNAALARFFSRLFGVRENGESAQVTEEEIRLMVDVGNEKGAIEQSEKDMINNIFEFDDRNVSEIMTHRTDMTAVPQTVSIGEIVTIAIETGFSRIPVYDEEVDSITGILYIKDLLCLIGRQEKPFDAREYMRPALFVPENMSCVDLLAQFRLSKVMIAIAVDEYGGTAGLISMEDLLESIVGNIQDEYDDEEEEVSMLSEGCYSIDGAVSIDDMERLFDVELDEDSDYDTIGGLLTDKLQRIPAPGEHPAVALSGILFTVLLVEDRRIARVRAERVPIDSEKASDRKKDR